MKVLLVLAIAALPASGCGLFIDCESESIEVAFEGNVQRGTERSDLEAFGDLALGNIGPDFRRLRDILVGDEYRSPAAIVWTLFSDDGPELIAFTVYGPYAVGAFKAIGYAFDGAGWGFQSVPSGAGAGVAMRDGDFIATDAAGSLEVVGVEPLSFVVDLEVTNEDPDTRRLRGQMDFELVVEDVVCE